MMARPATIRVLRRRWTISAVIVVLLHAGIAAAVLTWRETARRAAPPPPIAIDLAPISPDTDQGGTAAKPEEEKSATHRDEKAARDSTEPEPGAAESAAKAEPGKAGESADESHEAQTAARGEAKEPLAGPRVTALPPDDSMAMSGPGVSAPPAGAPGGGLGAASPFEPRIDPRIPEPSRESRKAGLGSERRKSILFRAPKAVARPAPRRGPPIGADGGVARNAIGLPLQASASPGVLDRRFVAGHASAANASAVGQTSGQGRAAAASGSGGGLGAPRPGARPGALGGPAANTGALNGTGFKSRVP
jgi:hypothetical protein